MGRSLLGISLEQIFASDLPGMFRSSPNSKVELSWMPRAMTRNAQMSTKPDLVFDLWMTREAQAKLLNAHFSKESKEKEMNDLSIYSLSNGRWYAIGQESYTFLVYWKRVNSQSKEKMEIDFKILFWSTWGEADLEKIILATKNTEAGTGGSQREHWNPINVAGNPTKLQILIRVCFWPRQDLLQVQTAGRYRLFFRVDKTTWWISNFPWKQSCKTHETLLLGKIFSEDPEDPLSFLWPQKTNPGCIQKTHGW